jgi:drug/metabolite transporter (DMT)-like permease
MSDAAAAPSSTPGTVIRTLPPIAGTALASMVLVIVGTIYLASTIGRDPSLAIPVTLDVIAAVLFVAAAVIASRIDDFAWRIFFVVARWALLGYVVIAGMIAFVFVRDSTPTEQLTVMIAGLVLFVLDVTMILAFSVARYQPPD